MINQNRQSLLDWTGHPLVDVGIATLCAMVNRGSPKELTMDDLDDAADEMAEIYFSGIFTNYNSCVFTMNAYDNPTSSPKKKKEYENRILRAHRAEPDSGTTSLRCVFSGRQATHLIERRQMPLLTGENVLNFFPAARGALPVSGTYLVALQALPLGGRRVEGKLLIAHSDVSEISIALAKKFLQDNYRLIELAKAGKLPGDGPSEILLREIGVWDAKNKVGKYPDAKAPATLISSVLMEIWDARSGSEFAKDPASITAYWISNSGQGPFLEILTVPSQLVRFLFIVNADPWSSKWKRIVGRGWCVPGKRGQKKLKKDSDAQDAPVIPGGPGRSRNNVLEALLAIYRNGFLDKKSAQKFVRRFLLTTRGLPKENRVGDVAKGEIALYEPELIDWDITQLFLMEVIGMDEKRIEAIKSFSDRLADYIEQFNDKSLFRGIVYADKPGILRAALVKAQRNNAKERKQLLFGLEDYISVFEADDAVGTVDLWLVKDLISIRVIEQLFQKGFFTKEDNQELLTEPDEIKSIGGA